MWWARAVSRQAIPSSGSTCVGYGVGQLAAQDARISRWHRVPDHVANKVNLLTDESIRLRKALKQRRFTYGNRIAPKIGMPKPPLARSGTPTCNRWRYFVPQHTSVDVGESDIPALVAIWPDRGVNMLPTLSGYCRLESLFCLRLQVSRNVPVVTRPSILRLRLAHRSWRN